MTNQSLSDLWRENRSKDPGTDIASILDGARIIAQSLNPKTEVTFAGVDLADTDRRQIRLSPRDLGNEYPVSGDIVDVLLGLTVHEVGHTLFSENRAQFVDKLTRKAGIDTYGNDRKQFDNLVNIFEDIYVDHLMTAYPGYKDYLQRERDHALGEFNPDSVTKPLEAGCTRGDMLNAMIYFTLAGGKMPKGISDENVSTLANIAKNANKMCTKKLSKSSAILGAWRILKELPVTLSDEERGFGMPAPITSDTGEQELEPAPEKAYNDAGRERVEQEELEKQEGLDEETQEGDGKEAEEDKDAGDKETTEVGDKEEEVEEEEMGVAGGTKGGIGEEEENIEPEPDIDPDLDLASMLDTLVDDKTKLPKDLAEEVSEAVIEKRSDLSQLLSYLAKDSHYTIIAYTPPEDAMRAAEARSQTASAEEKLRRILQDYRLRRTRDYRGLMSGRISGRRLHRVAYGDQRVFQRRERPEEIDMIACLLMDLSGSVCRYRPLIEQITCAICDAFQKEKMEFIALGYSENRGIVNIPRLYDREVGRVNLGLNKEWSMTPSYEGLAAAIAQLLRLGGKKQKILFHVTDGEPNSGRSNIIPELLDDARFKGIIDIHICLTSSGYPTSGFMSLYGADTMIINEINELPDVVDTELRKRLKI